MKRIRWSRAAADDLEAIYLYLVEHRPSLARSTVQAVYDAAGSLKRFPQRGRVGLVENTRELILAPMPYIIVYVVGAEAIQILRVIHAARERES